MQVGIVLAAAGAFIDLPIVRRLLTNVAESLDTPEVLGTQVDDWVIKILYGASAIAPQTRKATVEKQLGEVVQKYEEAKTKADGGDAADLDEMKRLRPLTLNPNEFTLG